MGSLRVFRRIVPILRRAFAALTIVGAMSLTTIPALAGTTGVLHGTVTGIDKAPLAGVAVTAIAATGTYKATTDSHGSYTIEGIYADTYTLSFSLNGYEPQSVTGEAVFADQAETVDMVLTKSLTTIAHVSSRSTASAYNPQLTTDTVTVNSSQIENLQGSSFNINEESLVASLPGAYVDSSGYLSIHGGRENEEGFEFEGIPYTDAYSNQFTNSLQLPGFGVASAQLTPGAGDASVPSNGTGSLNLVAKRGTYPSFSDLGFQVGGPGFNHGINFDYGTATKNGSFSEYFAFTDQNEAPVYGDITTPAAEVGAMGFPSYVTSTELLNNTVVKFGRNQDQSLQFFADIGQENYHDGYGGLAGYCFETCNPYFTNFFGPEYDLTTSQIQAISPLYPFQANANTTLAQANRPPSSDYQPDQAFKLQYTWNLNPTTYLSLIGYSVNNVVTFDDPNGGPSSIGVADNYIQQGGHTLGVTLKLQKQINDKNLVEVGADYGWLHPEYDFSSLGYTWYSDLINGQNGNNGQNGVYGTFGEYGAGGIPYDFLPAGTVGADGSPLPTGYLQSQLGTSQQMPLLDEDTSLNRRDESLYVNDNVDFTDMLKAHIGLRLDHVDYVGLPSPGLLPNCTFQYNPVSVAENPSYNVNNPAVTGNCPYIPNFSNITSASTNPTVLEPRIGFSWQTGKNTSIRATYERSVFFPVMGSVDTAINPQSVSKYNGVAPYDSFYGIGGTSVGPSATAVGSGNAVIACGVVPYLVPCQSYGQELYWAYQNLLGVPYQPIKPETANNYTVTLEHQFVRGFLKGVSVSVAPWTRYQYNTAALGSYPLLGANGQPEILNGVVQSGPAAAVNAGKEYGSGVDINIVKEKPYGIYGQWTMSYINEFSSVIPGSGNEDFFPSIPNSSLATGNVYRVGFLSPFQTTFGLTYKTKSGWRVNPRFTYNIGYPTGNGTLTNAYVNGVPVEIPNTNAVPGSAAGQLGLGPNYYVDPLNPGSVFSPNIAGTLGTNERSSPAGELTPPQYLAGITIEYAPPKTRLTFGFDMENLFNAYYGTPILNGRYQPIATGLSGPLTGYSSVPSDYTEPYGTARFGSIVNGQNVYTTFPTAIPRSFYFYVTTKV